MRRSRVREELGRKPLVAGRRREQVRRTRPVAVVRHSPGGVLRSLGEVGAVRRIRWEEEPESRTLAEEEHHNPGEEGERRILGVEEAGRNLGAAVVDRMEDMGCAMVEARHIDRVVDTLEAAEVGRIDREEVLR